MTNIIGSNECEVNGTHSEAASIQRPAADEATEMALTAGQAATLNFDLSEVASMTMDPSGALVIKFDDGGSLMLTNFSDIARDSTQTDVKFSDGTDLNFAGLFASLSGDVATAADNAIIAVLKPVGAIGETDLSFDLASGQEFIVDFNVEEVASVANENGDLIVTFVDGTRTVLENFDTVASSDLPPAMTLADGNVVEVAQLMSVLGANTGTDVADSGQDLQEVEPAAGETQAREAAQPAPQDLAAIEPAAGDAPAAAPAALGAQEGTTNFDSSIAAQDIAGLSAIGPIGVTALQFDLPEFEDPLFDANLAGATGPAPAAPPQLTLANQQDFEDTTGVDLQITAQPAVPANEYVTVTITGIPSGWTVTNAPATSVFTPATGTWTYRVPNGQTFSGGPSLVPPADGDGDATLNVSVSSFLSLNDQLVDTTTGVQTVLIDAVADPTTLTTNNYNANQGSPVAVSLGAALQDTDGSETITQVRITGLPTGFTIAPGTQDPNQTDAYIVNVNDLPNLTVTPPANFTGSAVLTLEVTNNETILAGGEITTNNNQQVNTQQFTINFAAVPPTPAVVVPNTTVEIFEDNQDYDNTGLRTGIVPIQANLANGTGNETMTVIIGNIPSTWTVSGGGLTLQGNGTYAVTLPAGQTFNQNVTFTVPADSDIDLSGVTVTANVVDPDFPATTTNPLTANDSFNIVVDAVIDPLTLTGTTPGGQAGSAIPLNVAISTPDTDGSETIGNLIVTGVPTGWTLSAGTLQGNGSWVLTTAQLAGLTITPAANAATQTVILTIDGSSTENPTTDQEIRTDNNSTTAQTTVTLNVTGAPVPPTVTNSTPGTIALNTAAEIFEDNQDFDNTGLRTGNIPLTATVNGGSGNEVLTVTLTGVPSTWTVTGGGLTLQANGSYTVTLPAGQSFNSTVNFQVPANSDVDLTGINFTSSVSDPDFPNNTIADTDVFDIVVDAVIDPLTLTATNANGNAGSAIPLAIGVSTPDTDGSETIGDVVITGVPSGWTLSAGTLQGNGSWVLTTAQLAGLTLTPATNAAAQTVTLTVNTSSTENTASDQEILTTNNDTTAQTTLQVTISPAPTVTNGTPGTIALNTAAEIFEDNQDFDNTGLRTGNIPLTATVNGGSGNEVLTVTLTGVPSTWTVTGGGLTLQANGSYTVTLPAGQNFNSVVNFQVPANSDVDLTGINFTSSVSDPDFPNTAITDTDLFDIVVDAVIDPLTLTATNANGGAGNAIPLSIAVSTPDTDGSETIGNLVVTGVPTGWTLSAGTLQGNGSWVLTTAQLAGLTLTPAANAAAQTVTLTVNTSSTENTASDQEILTTNNDTTAQTTLQVTISSVPTVTNTSPGVIGNNANAVIFEDNQDWDNTGLRTGNIPLTATVNGGSGNEVLTVTLAGVPSTWTVTGGGLTLQANGTYTATLPAGQDFNSVVNFQVPANSDVDLTGITWSSSVADPDFPNTAITDNNVFDIVVDAVVDQPNLTVNNASGSDNGPIALSIATSPSDTDGSESVTKVVISGVPSGFTLNAGTNTGPGTYELTPAQLAGLTLTPPSAYDGTITLTVVTHVSETQLDNEYTLANNDTTRTANLQVTITDSNPTFTNVPVTLAQEGDLANGTETVTGTMTADFGDDNPGTFCVPTNGAFTSSGAQTANALTSGGVPVTVTSNGNVYTGVAGSTTVFTMTVNANGTFTFNLFAPLDHSNTSSTSELINLNFAVCAEDSDGDMTSSTLTVQVRDSGATAVNDVAYFATCDQVAHGNVINGFNGYSGNNPANHDDTMSQDTPTYISSVAGNTFGASGAMALEGNFGTLYMFNNGSYVYVQHTDVSQARTETFSYTLTDGDGDTSTATLTVQGINSNTSFNPWKSVTTNANPFYNGTNNAEYIKGCEVADTLYGQGGDDFIAGGSGNDNIYGGAGNDVIWGELGADNLWGGAGADIFTAATNDMLGNVVDTIKDFNLSEGDVLDLRHLLDHGVYNPSGANLTQFVRSVNTTNGSMIQVNPDGAGSTYGWMDAVFIEGQQNLDVQQMFNNGNLEMI